MIALVLVCAGASAAAEEPLADDPDPSPMAGYNGGFFLESEDGDFHMGLGGRVQVLYFTRLAESGDDFELDAMNLSIRRARIKLQGHAFTERLTYTFQSDFSGDSASLLDFYANYELAPETLEVRAGRWRFPFLRQEITSSGSLMLVDRSVVTGTFGHDRDVGVALHNGYKSSPPFEWVLGVFNGSTSSIPAVSFEDERSPVLFGPAVLARGAYNFGEMSGYSEADFARGPLRFSVGGSVAAQPGIERPNESELKATLDYIVKVGGFSSSGAVMAASLQEPGEGFGARDHFATGFFSQAGYMITDRLQPVARYGQVRFSDTGRDALGHSTEVRHEALAGLSYYFHDHQLKLQTDFGALVDETARQTHTDLQGRAQLQLAF